MKQLHLLVRLSSVLLILACFCVMPTFAITETDVENEVAAAGREAVTGNVLIWFLCAVAFLKVSQKIDSFMSSLGVNVGHTGGSMLAEVMIAAKTVSSVASGAGRIFSGGRSSGSTGPKGADGSPGFLHGGLAGVVSRKVTSDAVKSATSAKHTSATHTAAVSASHREQAAQTIHRSQATQFEQTVQNSQEVQNDQAVHTGSVTQHDQDSPSESRAVFEQDTSHVTHQEHATQHDSSGASTTGSPSSSTAAESRPKSLGAAIFASSLRQGGSFANRVIGRVATGEIRTAGSITGDMAAQSLMSYMGYTALGETSSEKISFREVEIGGGRITGVESTPQHPEGIAFGMYHADQYSRPEGEYTKIYSADGEPWYKQYAVNSVSRTPYKAPDGEIAYHSEIVKKLPQPPKRKNRI